MTKLRQSTSTSCHLVYDQIGKNGQRDHKIKSLKTKKVTALASIFLLSLFVSASASASSTSGLEKANKCIDKSQTEERVTLQCQSPNVINVSKSFYGFTDDKDRCILKAKDCTQPASTSHCNGKSKCVVSLSTFGSGLCDRQHYQSKFVDVSYRCVLNKIFQKSRPYDIYVLEGNELALKCYSHPWSVDFPIWYQNKQSNKHELLAQGQQNYSKKFNIVQYNEANHDYWLRTKHAGKEHAGTYTCKRKFGHANQTEEVAIRVIVYARPKCAVDHVSAEPGSIVTASCKSRIWGRDPNRKEEISAPLLRMWYEGGSENVASLPFPDAKTQIQNDTIVVLTVKKELTVIDNQTHFKCRMSNRVDDGKTEECKSKNISLKPSSQIDKHLLTGAIMGSLIVALSLAICFTLVYKGVICRGQRSIVLRAIKVCKQNNGIYVTCPDEPVQTRFDAVENFLSKDGSTDGERERINERSHHCSHCHESQPQGDHPPIRVESNPLISRSSRYDILQKVTFERERGPEDTMDIDPTTRRETVFNRKYISTEKNGAVPKRQIGKDVSKGKTSGGQEKCNQSNTTKVSTEDVKIATKSKATHFIQDKKPASECEKCDLEQKESAESKSQERPLVRIHSIKPRLGLADKRRK